MIGRDHAVLTPDWLPGRHLRGVHQQQPRPRRGGGGLRHRERRGLLAREGGAAHAQWAYLTCVCWPELLGVWLGGEGLHPGEERSGHVRHRRHHRPRQVS